MTRMRLAVVTVAMATAAPSAQAPSAPAPAFEVAAVRLNTSGDTRSSYSGPPNGLIVITNMTLRMMVIEAYGIPGNLARFTLVGGDERILSARFDVNAKAPAGTPRDQQRLMLQTLLVERFGLRIDADTREIPVYALTVSREGRLGPQLRRSVHNCTEYRAAAAKAGVSALTDPDAPRDAAGQPWCTTNYDFTRPGSLGLRGAGVIGDLVQQVQGFVDRPVLDHTGLDGNLEWTVTFARVLVPDADSPAASIFTALDEQLGLKLEPRTAPMDVRVIDAVEMPATD